MNCVESLHTKIVSSLEKCFLDSSLEDYNSLNEISFLRNEKLSFQIAYKYSGAIDKTPLAGLEILGELKDFITVSQVVGVPSNMPINPQSFDDDYLRTKPGIYPDLLMPLHYNGRVNLMGGSLGALWIDIELPKDFPAGNYETVFELYSQEGRLLSSNKIDIEVIACDLPELNVYHTEWFHCDCLSEYYHCDMFSEKHFEILKNYIGTMAQNGINAILTPVFTPALDTYVGGERPTCQLVGITVNGGEYKFDYSLLHRWIDMCLECGMKYFEIPPFFSQWGAKHAPKIMAEKDGKYERIFGWETDAVSDEYKDFLNAFIPSLLKEFENRNLSDKLLFHVSDEPDLDDFDHYKAAASVIKSNLEGYTIIDAVWNLKVFKTGVLSTPVVSIGVAEDFINAGAENYWVYYCGGHTQKVSNRFFAMPSYRTRILGIQMYNCKAKGFLHWGYNYWHNRYSYDTVNPYLDTSGEYFAPSGDMSLVYPSENGKALPSLRLRLMRDAMQDIRALTLCEQIYGREYTENLINGSLKYNLNYCSYPKEADYILKLRRKVNEAIKASVKQSESSCK